MIFIMLYFFVKKVVNMDLKEIELEINKLKERNKKVELDKEWESSWLRKFIVAFSTYIIVVIYSVFVNRDGNIYLNCLVPVIGFVLSTMSVNFIKKIWIKQKIKVK